jgi:hypothetical protein
MCNCGNFYILSFDCFLLSPCTTNQWLAYHWWYAYHSLMNPDVEDLILSQFNLVQTLTLYIT